MYLFDLTGGGTLKMPVAEMMDIVEEAVKKINTEQLTNPTIRHSFQKAGQDPWFDWDEVFKAHLDSLEQDALYKKLIDNQRGADLD